MTHSYRVFADRWSRIGESLERYISESQRADIEAAFKDRDTVFNGGLGLPSIPSLIGGSGKPAVFYEDLLTILLPKNLSTARYILKWNSTGANQCRALGTDWFWTNDDNKTLNGSEERSGGIGTHVYGLECLNKNSFKGARDDIIIEIKQDSSIDEPMVAPTPVVVDIKASDTGGSFFDYAEGSPLVVIFPYDFYLRWESFGVNTCELSEGSRTNNVPTGGEERVDSKAVGTYVYNLECSNSAGDSKSDSVAIEIREAPPTEESSPPGSGEGEFDPYLREVIP